MHTTRKIVTDEKPTESVRRRRRLGWSVGLAALALVAAACSGGGSSSGAGLYGAAPATSSGASMAAVVDLRGANLGQILVDGRGRTLYLFAADTAGKSNCHGACTSAWPPYLSSGTPKAGAGVTGGQLGTIPGDGGETEIFFSDLSEEYVTFNSAYTT